MNSIDYKTKIETIIRNLAKIGVAVLGVGFSEDDYIHGNSFIKKDGIATQRFVRCYLVQSHIPPDATLKVIAIKTISIEEYKKEDFLKYQLEVLEFALISLFENGWGTINPNEFVEFEPKFTKEEK